MLKSGFKAAMLAATLLSAGCVSAPPPLDRGYLSEDQVVNLMRHPKTWDGATVRIWVFPYDYGSGDSSYPLQSYVLCFEACDEKYADRSPFVLFTGSGRFAGYKGDRPVLITARYSSICAYKPGESWRCVHERFGQFTEIEDGPPRTERPATGSDRQ
jgi:hypothetical protein